MLLINLSRSSDEMLGSCVEALPAVVEVLAEGLAVILGVVLDVVLAIVLAVVLAVGVLASVLAVEELADPFAIFTS